MSIPKELESFFDIFNQLEDPRVKRTCIPNEGDFVGDCLWRSGGLRWLVR